MEYVTKKGTVLPLINLKGKSYMMVTHRMVWFNEEVSSFKLDIEYIQRDNDTSVVKATIIVLDDKGFAVKQASSTKREDRKDFSDHLEKAETGSIGRCLALLGFGTAYALADFDEGHRVVDSPLKSGSDNNSAHLNLQNQGKQENKSDSTNSHTNRQTLLVAGAHDPLNVQVKPVTEAQLTRLFAIANVKNWSKEEIEASVFPKLNIKSLKEMNQDQYQTLCNHIERHPKEKKIEVSKEFEELEMPPF